MAYDYISRGKAKENGYTNTRVFKLFGVSSTGYYNYVARREDCLLYTSDAADD